jgi:phospholipid/cholesterol/gamma-HCH transport system substrate-binding protein
MGFQIGAFRLDRNDYSVYDMYFKDISGLSRKADVKIAGVKVGWVSDVGLDENSRARARIQLKKEYNLYSDATALVRQDGLLGPKYVEIIPGDPLQLMLKSGDALGKAGFDQVSLDELMRDFKHIASNVSQLTDSINNAIGGVDGREQLQNFVTNVTNTFAQFSTVSDVLARSLTRNEQNIDTLLSIGTDIKQVTDMLQRDLLPSFQQSIERISIVFDRDFDRIAGHMQNTAQSLQQASEQAREGMKSITSVAEKIDEGKGLIGKLINEDETYKDLKSAIQGIKNYTARVERIQVQFDTHFESMHRIAEHYDYQDSKGYFDVFIRPTEHYFYQVQLASSQKGFIERKETIRRYVDSEEQPVDISALNLQSGTLKMVDDTYREKKTKIYRNSLKVGLQFGKQFGDLVTLRMGLFEGTSGVGLDVKVPFDSEKFKWISTIELFDMSGWNRLDDKRPHIKWLNRMHFLRNIYVTFGADDFISKNNASAFVGAGINFGDDDIKYLLSSISGAAGGLGS